jgi:chorismate synthase
MKLINKDHEKWLNVMSSKPVDTSDPEVQKQLEDKFISRVRPGHADFAGALKYHAEDVRDILERSSARETTSRVAVGAVCKKFLQEFGIEIYSHVLRIGELECATNNQNWWSDLNQDEYSKRKQLIENSELRIYDPSGLEDQKFKDYIDSIRKKGDTVGGLLEVFALGVPVGLGSHVQWDRRLDGLIAQALMSIHTVKSVEIGIGDQVSELLGSQVHDQIFLNQDSSDNSDLRYTRKTNNSGGIEGGMSNGMPITCRVGVKPIPTLVSKLASVDLSTKTESESHFERSDVCVVPAAGVVLEAMLAFVIAKVFLEKFGGDSMQEISRNYKAYLEQCSGR